MEKRSNQDVPPLNDVPTSSRLFLLCECCGVCRQHLLSIPKDAPVNELSEAKCTTCGKTIWVRVKPTIKDQTGPLHDKHAVARSGYHSKFAKQLSAISAHPRTAALLAYARRAIEHQSQRLIAREKALVLLNIDPMRAASDLKYAIKLANKRLLEYAPALGVEQCPECFVFSGKTVLLLYQRDPVVSGSKFVIVTCSTCGFIGSIPSI
jgi:hypothetical protein